MRPNLLVLRISFLVKFYSFAVFYFAANFAITIRRRRRRRRKKRRRGSGGRKRRKEKGGRKRKERTERRMRLGGR